MWRYNVVYKKNLNQGENPGLPFIDTMTWEVVFKVLKSIFVSKEKLLLYITGEINRYI